MREAILVCWVCVRVAVTEELLDGEAFLEINETASPFQIEAPTDRSAGCRDSMSEHLNIGMSRWIEPFFAGGQRNRTMRERQKKPPNP